MECFIFSRDRGMQLHNLLSSIPFSLFDSITVLYSTSNNDFEKGYKKVSKSFPKVKFIQETDFRQNVLDHLKNSQFEFTCLMVDDAIFYRKNDAYTKDKIIDTFNKFDIISFILGVGKNCTWSMTANKAFNFPEPHVVHNDAVYIYNWKTSARKSSEFECPFMVVGNVFKTSILYKYSSIVDFQKPNSYEIKLQMFIQQFYRNELPDLCACFEYSSIVHSPNNVVQTEWGQCNGDVAKLNNMYLQDVVIDLDNLNFENIHGLHANIELKFKNEDSN